MTVHDETLDAALDSLTPYGCELVNGNFNHAPMVAEALCALGRPDAVSRWLERYRPRLTPRGDIGEPIAAADWRAALGKRDRFPAWSEFFAAALAERPWPEVLDLWAERLAPGIAAAATHGVIRTGHAVRALAAGETPPRRREFADALASWAASYAELPAARSNNAAKLPPDAAIAKVAIVPPERRRPGNIVSALARLGEFPEFAPVIDLADLDGDIAGRLAALTELFARVYLTNAHNIPTAIAFIHGVTSLTALGHVAPHVGKATARSLLRYGWQVGCGLYACFGGATPFAADVETSQPGWNDLIERALTNGDEHVIKFTEACRCRDSLAASPVYPAAAGHVLTIFGAARPPRG